MICTNGSEITECITSSPKRTPTLIILIVASFSPTLAGSWHANILMWFERENKLTCPTFWLIQSFGSRCAITYTCISHYVFSFQPSSRATGSTCRFGKRSWLADFTAIVCRFIVLGSSIQQVSVDCVNLHSAPTSLHPQSTLLPIPFLKPSLCLNPKPSFMVIHDILNFECLAHMFGDQPYNPHISPRENPFVSYGAFGEGFHNYHHSFPWDYKTRYDLWLVNVIIAAMRIIHFHLINFSLYHHQRNGLET